MGIAYKFLQADGSATHTGFRWPLPEGRRYGAWAEPIKGDLFPCENGYHVCERTGLIEWLNARLFVCEWRGDHVWKNAKRVRVVREARLIREVTAWNDRTQRLFAADCAERVLHLYEARFPGDSRVRDCIDTARRVAHGRLPASELTDARAAADSAAYRAASAAYSADSAYSAAYSADGGAAYRAAYSARAAASASAADGEAERKWQSRRLLEMIAL